MRPLPNSRNIRVWLLDSFRVGSEPRAQVPSCGLNNFGHLTTILKHVYEKPLKWKWSDKLVTKENKPVQYLRQGLKIP